MSERSGRHSATVNITNLLEGLVALLVAMSLELFFLHHLC